MTRHPDLLTRAEVAELLGVSVRKLEGGWGPPRLPEYRRPVYYSRRVVDKWLRDQEAQCSTNAVASGGSNSSTRGRATVSRRAKQILAQRRKQRRKSARELNGPPVLVVVKAE